MSKKTKFKKCGRCTYKKKCVPCNCGAKKGHYKPGCTVCRECRETAGFKR